MVLRRSLIGLLVVGGLTLAAWASLPRWAPALATAVASSRGVLLDELVIEDIGPRALALTSVAGRYDGHAFALRHVRITPPWRAPSLTIAELTLQLADTAEVAASPDARPATPAAETATGALADLLPSKQLPTLPVTALTIDRLTLDGLPGSSPRIAGDARIDRARARLSVRAADRELELELTANAQDEMELRLTAPPAPGRADDARRPTSPAPLRREPLAELSARALDGALAIDATLQPELLPTMIKAFGPAATPALRAWFPAAADLAALDPILAGRIQLRVEAPAIARLTAPGREPASGDRTGAWPSLLYIDDGTMLRAQVTVDEDEALGDSSNAMTLSATLAPAGASPAPAADKTTGPAQVPARDAHLRIAATGPTGGQLESDGALRLIVAARGGDLEAATLDLVVSDLAGTVDRPSLALSAQLAARHRGGTAALSARARAALADGVVQLSEGARLSIDDAQHGASGFGLRGARLVTPRATQFDPARPGATALAAQLAIDTLTTPDGDFALDLRSELAGDLRGARLTLAGAGLELALRADAPQGMPEAMVVELSALELQAGSSTDLARRALRHFDPLPGLTVEAGSVTASGRLWPLDDDTQLTLSLIALSAGLDGGRLTDAAAQLNARFEQDTLVLRSTSLRAARVQQDLIDARDVTAELDARLPAARNLLAPGEHDAAPPRNAHGRGDDPQTAAGNPPIVTFELRQLAVSSLRYDDYVVRGITAAGTGRQDRSGMHATLALRADSADAGVPLAGIDCGIDLTPTTARISTCGFDALGGHIVAPAGEIDLASRSGYVPVAIQGVDLGAVLALMQDDGLQGDGVLDGALPLRLEDGTPVVRDGYVGARPPGGHIAYAADAALLARMRQPGVGLALTALGDFRYQRLGSYVDYDDEGTLGLRASLAGASPAVENGRAINFNLDVTQNLPLLLKSLRLSQTIEESIERRLRERQRAP